MEHTPSLPASAADQTHENHLQTLNGQAIRDNETLGQIHFHLNNQICVLLSVKYRTHNTANGQSGQAIFVSEHLCHWSEKPE